MGQDSARSTSICRSGRVGGRSKDHWCHISRLFVYYYLEDGGHLPRTSEEVTAGITGHEEVSTSVYAKEAIGKVALHRGLERADVVALDDQVRHVLICIPSSCGVSRDVSP